MSLAKKLLSESLIGKVDTEIIDELIALNNRKPNFLKNQIKLFIENSNDLLSQFDSAIENKNEIKTKEIAHSLKGTYANFGALELTKIFNEIQLQNSIISFENLKENTVEIKEKINTFIDYLKKINNFEK